MGEEGNEDESADNNRLETGATAGEDMLPIGVDGILDAGVMNRSNQIRFETKGLS